MRVSTNRLRKAFGAFLAAVVAQAANTAVAVEDATAAEPMAEIEAYLERIRTLRARFEQTVEDADGFVVDEASGTVAIERPNRFRWEYANPAQLVLADGQFLWVYDPDLASATQAPLDETLAATPALLLSGSGSLAETYRDAGTVVTEGITWFALEPLRPDTDFRRVELGFDGDGLRFMRLSDALNQVTRIQFSDVEQNEALPEELFQAQFPDEVDIVGASQ